MSERSYLQHARRHARRGSDPMIGLHSEYLFASFNRGYDSAGNQSVSASGVEHNVAWHSMETSNQDVFATSTAATGDPTNAAGDVWVQLLKPGLYLAKANLDWEAATFNRYCYITRSSGIGVVEVATTAAGAIVANGQAASSTSVHAGYELLTQAAEMIIATSDYSGVAIKLVAGNQDASARNITGGTIGVYYLGGADMATETDYTVY